MKKVIYVVTKSNFGGAQRYVLDLATHAESFGYVPFVIAGGNGILFEKLAEKNIEYFSLPELKRDVRVIQEIKTFVALLRIFQKEKPDVVHLNSSKIGGLGSLAARIARVPHIIYTVHGWVFNEDRPWWQKGIISFLTWLTVLFSHTTITICNHDHRQGKYFPFLQDDIARIHNGIDTPSFLSREEALQELGVRIPSTAFILGTIGELHTNKGHIFLLKAFTEVYKQYPDMHLVIIGEGEERETLETYILEHDLTDNVHLVGFVDNASRMLESLDIFVFPSFKEGLPYVLLEAGHAKLPVIASRVGGIPDIIKNTQTGILIHPHTIEDIQANITKLYTDAEYRTTLAQHLHEYVRTDFTLEKMLTDTFELYT